MLYITYISDLCCALVNGLLIMYFIMKIPKLVLKQWFSEKDSINSITLERKVGRGLKDIALFYSE